MVTRHYSLGQGVGDQVRAAAVLCQVLFITGPLTKMFATCVTIKQNGPRCVFSRSCECSEVSQVRSVLDTWVASCEKA